MSSYTDCGRPVRSFFQHIPNFVSTWIDWLNELLGIWSIFGSSFCIHFVTLIFLKKRKEFQFCKKKFWFWYRYRNWTLDLVYYTETWFPLHTTRYAGFFTNQQCCSTNILCLDFKLFTVKIMNQTQIDIPWKCLKSLGYSRKNDWVMKNQGQSWCLDKICAKCATGNTPNKFHFILPICQISQNIWDMLGKVLTGHP